MAFTTMTFSEIPWRNMDREEVWKLILGAFHQLETEEKEDPVKE